MRPLGRLVENDFPTEDSEDLVDPGLLVEVLRSLRAENLSTSETAVLQRLQEWTGQEWTPQQLQMLSGRQVFYRNEKSLPRALREAQAQALRRSQAETPASTSAKDWLNAGLEQKVEPKEQKRFAKATLDAYRSHALVGSVAVSSSVPIGARERSASGARSSVPIGARERSAFGARERAASVDYWRGHGDDSYSNRTWNDDSMRNRTRQSERSHSRSHSLQRGLHQQDSLARKQIRAAMSMEPPIGMPRHEPTDWYEPPERSRVGRQDESHWVRKELPKQILQRPKDDRWGQWQYEFEDERGQYESEDERGQNESEHSGSVQPLTEWTQELKDILKIGDDRDEDLRTRAATPPPPSLSFSNSRATQRQTSAPQMQGAQGQGAPLQLCRPPDVEPGSWNVLSDHHSTSTKSIHEDSQYKFDSVQSYAMMEWWQSHQAQYQSYTVAQQNLAMQQWLNLQQLQQQPQQQQAQLQQQLQQNGGTGGFSEMATAMNANLQQSLTQTSQDSAHVDKNVWPYGLLPAPQPESRYATQSESAKVASTWRPLQSAIRSMENQGQQQRQNNIAQQQSASNMPFQAPGDASIKLAQVVQSPSGVPMQDGTTFLVVQQPQQQDATWQMQQQLQWQQQQVMVMMPTMQSPSSNPNGAQQQALYPNISLQQHQPAMMSRKLQPGIQPPVTLHGRLIESMHGEPHAEPDPQPVFSYGFHRVATPEPDAW